MRLGMAISLLETVRAGDIETAKKILRQKQCLNLDKQTSRKDGTPLFWACCQGFIEIVNLLLLKGADVDLTTQWGASPMHACVDNNQVDILRLLIDYGANVNKQTRNGDTPCHLAAYRGYGNCVQLLAESGANVLIRNNKQKTPLQEATSSGHYEISRYLQAVQNLSQESSPADRSMSIPFGSVQTVTSSIDDHDNNTQYNFNPYTIPQTQNTRYISSQTHYDRNASHSLENPRSQSERLYSKCMTSANTSQIYYQSGSTLNSSNASSLCSYPPVSNSSFCSYPSLSSNGYGVGAVCDQKEVLGVLRIRSLESGSDCSMNDLSSVDTSNISTNDSTKPLTVRNI